MSLIFLTLQRAIRIQLERMTLRTLACRLNVGSRAEYGNHRCNSIESPAYCCHRARGRDLGLTENGDSSSGSRSNRAKKKAREELSKFAVLLSPSLVDRMRMYRSCGDLTAAGYSSPEEEGEEASTSDEDNGGGDGGTFLNNGDVGNRGYPSNGDSKKKAGAGRSRQTSWFPLIELLRPVMSGRVAYAEQLSSAARDGGAAGRNIGGKCT
jgi:hypothetical protein